MPGISTYGSDYVKSAVALYLLPATDPDTAIGWYTQALTACGYIPAGRGISGGASGIVSQAIMYASPTIPSLEIELSFEQSPSGGTLLLYDVIVLSLPPRSRASYVPWDARQVNLTYDPAFPSGGPQLSVTLRSRRLVAELADAVNALDTISPGVHSCGGLQGAATMVFVKAHTRMTVTDSCGDVRIDQFHPLSDRYGEVWKSVRDVVSTYCRKRRCAST